MCARCCEDCLVDQRPHRDAGRSGSPTSSFAVSAASARETPHRRGALDIDAIDAVAELAGVGEAVAGDAPAAALSRSASAQTIAGLWPPSSSVTRFSVRSPRRRSPCPPRAAGEGDLRGSGWRDQRLAELAPAAGDDIEHAGGIAGLVEQARRATASKRRVLGGLGDQRAAGDQRRAELESAAA